MRIVGGEWGGRPIKAPQGTGTRPTSDRVREALFSMIEARYSDALVDGTVLDAFAGSGALALESLSRGASIAIAVESDPSAIAVIDENIRTLGAGGCLVLRGDVFELLRADRLDGGPFSLLLLDPPYRIGWAQVRGLLEGLSSSGLIHRGAVTVYEHAREAAGSWPEGFVEAGSKTYGDTALSIAVFGREA